MRRVRRFGDMTIKTKSDLRAYRKGVKLAIDLLDDINRHGRVIALRGETAERRDELNRLTAIYRDIAAEYNTKHITALAKGLPEADKFIFVLYYGNAMPVKTISGKYHYSERQVYYILKRSRARLNISEV